MTTAIFDRTKRELGADTQNTMGGFTKTRIQKIELLSNGWYFMGSGHCHTIAQCREWAATGWDKASEPDWALYLEEPSEYDFSCLAIDPETWDVWMIESEMVPFIMLDRVCGVGSGAAYAIGAIEAGASMERALEIAGDHDIYTSGPYEVLKLG